jgi:hypothetical protein
MPRRLFAWCAAQIKHVLPPTIFFFAGFNLILWTKQLILKEHGIDFSGFITATFAALLIGKAVLVTDNLPLMHRFDGAPLIRFGRTLSVISFSRKTASYFSRPRLRSQTTMSMMAPPAHGCRIMVLPRGGV